jgi:hypothetical protein
MCLESDERSESCFRFSIKITVGREDNFLETMWISVLSNVAHHPVTTTELDQIGV